MRGVSSFQRSRKFLGDKGWVVWKTENHYQGRSHDLANIYDAIGFSPEGDTYLLQFCGGSDYKAHVRKMMEEFPHNVRIPLVCKTRVLLIGWRKLLVKRGGKAMHWVPRIAEITTGADGLVLTTKDEI